MWADTDQYSLCSAENEILMPQFLGWYAFPRAAARTPEQRPSDNLRRDYPIAWAGSLPGTIADLYASGRIAECFRAAQNRNDEVATRACIDPRAPSNFERLE